MTVEQQIGGGTRDQFPVGMRVLAVDDDPTCLLVLEALLRRCQYHVTTTSQAVAALKMLRENRNRFDLVISDVHMPDMDGFKLLEHVGLEMDLPVIMLSANDDPKLVMKGITHGACDYLLKPIRIEELKNIWQHVIRRRKLDNKDRYNFDNSDKSPPRGSEAITDPKLNKKRKDDDEDRDENDRENDDPSTQKKPRVVWSGDLHRKFVAAVNQLGIEKAVPKKILDLMNVEKLTRENVASHLQKYRLYLKRISMVANQQAHMVAALGSSDASYLQTGSVPGFGFHNAALRSLPSNGILGRLNSPASLGIHGLPFPGVNQLGHVQNPSHLSNSPTHFQPVLKNDRNALQGNSYLNDCFKQATLHLSTVSDDFSEMALRSAENSSDSIAGQMINNSGIHGNGGGLDPNNTVFCRTSFDSAIQPNFFDPSLMRTNNSQNLAMEALMRSNDGYGMNQLKNLGSYIPNKFGTLEDITGLIVKQEPDKMTVTDDFGFGLFC